jgi:hypothetical protein
MVDIAMISPTNIHRFIFSIPLFGSVYVPMDYTIATRLFAPVWKVRVRCSSLSIHDERYPPQAVDAPDDRLFIEKTGCLGNRSLVRFFY